MCRLLGDSPLNNVLDFISNYKQKNKVQLLICLKSKRPFIYKQ